MKVRCVGISHVLNSKGNPLWNIQFVPRDLESSADLPAPEPFRVAYDFEPSFVLGDWYEFDLMPCPKEEVEP